MDMEKKSNDIYGLITELSKQIYQSNCPANDQPYFSQRCEGKILKKLKLKAFEILLKKSSRADYVRDDEKEKHDPIVEILKYTFALKIGAQYASKATQLEKLLKEFTVEDLQENNTVYSALQFLIELKNFKLEPHSEINIFHYGKPNPVVPDGPYSEEDAPMFQIYPIEAFVLSEKFDAMLEPRERYIESEISTKYLGKLFLDQVKSGSTIDIESIRYDSDSTKALLCAPTHSSDTYATDFSTISYFLPTDLNKKVDAQEYLSFGRKNNLITDISIPDRRTELICENSDTSSDSWESLNHSECNRVLEMTYLEWDVNDLENIPSYLRTWETLGLPETAKQPLFLSDTLHGILHMARIQQTSTLLLLPQTITIPLLKEVSAEKFLKDVKLLLYGIESELFQYDQKTGFKLQSNIAVYGITSESLVTLCQEPIEWGNSFRFLSDLVKMDLRSRKLQQQGFIFKAMCTNIKQFLLYYQATLLRVFANIDKTNGVLNVLTKIRPVANLIIEITRLCQYYEGNSSPQDEGSGILTHIYREVTKITNPRVALVFYSILKSCCEVYFRFLQKWLFEGKCDDIYGEFMIRMWPQYLRIRGHKFWTKSFSVHEQAVPGFLSNLSDSILQCGKAVRLLKTCDPKNPVCNVFATSQPELKVCLSVAMLREQLAKCQEYAQKGDNALNPAISLSSAIQYHKEIEKEQANLAICVQQETLSRIKREQEEIAKNIAESKRELLRTLKEQAREVALHREKEKEAELLADKLLMEALKQEEKEAQEIQHNKSMNLLSCYNELITDAENRRMRAEWRIKRMNHFAKRIHILATMNEELCISTNNLTSNVDDNTESEKDSVIPEINNEESQTVSHNMELQSLRNHFPVEDENKNITIDQNLTVQVPDDSFSADDGVKKQEIKVGYSEPTVDSKIESDCLPSSKDDTESEMNIDNLDNKVSTSESDTQNKSSVRANNIYKKNNERSDLQEFFLDNKVSTSESDTQNKSSVRADNIYKKNNERSDLQEFLRHETIKDEPIMQTIADRKTKNITNTKIENVANAKDTLTTNQHIINRPNFLTIKKLDCMTAAEINKMKVLQHEYGMTPNNNELNIFFMAEKKTNVSLNTENGNVIENTTKHGNIIENTTDLNLIDNKTNQNKHINENQIASEIVNSEKTEAKTVEKNLHIIKEETDNHQNVIINSLSKEEMSQSYSTSMENNIDTPMSCTTDNFVPSADTPTSQFQTGEITTPSDLSSKMSTSYEPIKSLTEESYDFFQSKLTISNSMSFAADLSPASPSSYSLTLADVEMIDNTSLEVYLEKSITIPLQVQSRLVNSALIKYLIKEHNMLLHLQSLRSYFFLLNGEFAKSLTDSLYSRLYEISVPIELFNSATLMNLLEKALVNSFTSGYINSELLSLSAIDIPQQLHISDPDALDCLCLNYKISWPLNIILDDTVMLQYSKVFKFLIMIGRVSWVLQEDFSIMKNERKAAMSEQYHKLQLYRHSMTQFMNALHNYITCSVLHASWAEFEKDLQNCVTLDQIYFSHITYIKKILSRCMLNIRGEKIRTCLNNVFRVILQFHNRLTSQEWTASSNSYVHPNFKKLEQMYKAFCELRTYMAHVAFKLATSGYQPHLMHFLNALNINHLYDLTVKTP